MDGCGLIFLRGVNEMIREENENYLKYDERLMI